MKEQTLTALIDTLRQTRTLSDAELSRLYHERTPETDAYLYAQADAVRREVYGNAVYLRGLIEISNICKNDCLYCGIRRSNGAASRYRLTLEDLLACCEHGYALGFRTFVLQGGEDPYYTDERMESIIRTSVFPTARSPSPWASAAAKAMPGFTRLGRVATCCAMRRRQPPTTKSCIRRR